MRDTDASHAVLVLESSDSGERECPQPKANTEDTG